jgi:tRNA dimethylallyltransferase
MKPLGLIVILGATATGKTGLAIALAQKLNSPIINADSRQIYRYLDIGTAKPSVAERQGVPHYLIDIAEPNTILTLAQYQTAAQQLIAQFQAQGITPILVGGTGLYIKSIVCGMKIPKVAPQLELRSQLAAIGQVQCHQMLRQVDPQTTIHPNDQFRTLRSLEVYYVTGVPLSQQQSLSPPTYDICQIGITTPEIDLHKQWISDRLDKMLELGWLDEIKSLQTKFGIDLPLLRTLGYAEMSDYLSGQTDLNIAKQLTITHTSQFAKQQRTWFQSPQNANGEIHWVSTQNEPESLLTDAMQIINTALCASV